VFGFCEACQLDSHPASSGQLDFCLLPSKHRLQATVYDPIPLAITPAQLHLSPPVGRRLLKINIKQATLVEELRKREQELQADPTKRNLKVQINILKHKVNLLDTNELTKQMKLAKQSFFENANKPGRWLAYKVKKEREKRLISKLKDGEGLQVQNTQIKKIAEDFFARLYRKEEFSIEKVLNRNIRDDKDIKDTKIRDEKYKLQVFTDDLVFIIEEPFVKIPKLLQRIEEYGIIRYDNILDKDGGLKLDQEIQEQGLNILWWYKVQMQLRYAKDCKIWGFYKDLTAFDQVMLKTDEKMIKRIYEFLLDRKMEGEQVKETMITWAQNFGYNIELEKWQKLWERNIKVTLATSYKENLYKMFYRWYLLPNQLAKMLPNMSNRCWKCKHDVGTFYHMWWTCEYVKKYWIKIHKWLEEMLQKPLAFKPEIFLLGIVPENISKQENFRVLALCYFSPASHFASVPRPVSQIAKHVHHSKRQHTPALQSFLAYCCIRHTTAAVLGLVACRYVVRKIAASLRNEDLGEPVLACKNRVCQAGKLVVKVDKRELLVPTATLGVTLQLNELQLQVV
ncbi:hypothetical protein EYD10_17095, partial [Varanus komodoensis]